VVLNYGRETLTAGCVAALERSVGVAPRILIVDNASPDGSGARLQARFPQHDFLQTGENLGYAGGNALGIARALAHDAEFVLVINDDAEVAPDALQSLVTALEADERAAAAGPTIRFDDAAASICWAGGELVLSRALGTPEPRDAAARSVASRPCSFVSGCCVLLRSVAVRAVGSFRAEYFAYVEDVELSLRLSRAGWRLLYVPEAAVVHHAPWPEPEAAPWKLRLRDLNRRRMVRAHYRPLERLRFALWFYPTRALHFVHYAIRGDRARAGAIWRGAFEGFRGGA
jgi:GT2 family glycosyltransferase